VFLFLLTVLVGVALYKKEINKGNNYNNKKSRRYTKHGVN
jgi:hypothetical protein